MLGCKEQNKIKLPSSSTKYTFTSDKQQIAKTIQDQSETISRPNFSHELSQGISVFITF
jgi:hypothetical protein